MLLKNIATVNTGLVLSRKISKAPSCSEKKYKVLTLRSIRGDGILKEQLDTNYFSNVSNEYLTKKGDVVVRLSAPNTATYITDEFKELVIPSQFCVVRLNSERFLPEYIAWYICSPYIKKQIQRDLSGSTVSIIRKGTLESLKIECISKKEQIRILRIIELQRKERGLLEKLRKEKESLYKGMIDKILKDGGQAENDKTGNYK